MRVGVYVDGFNLYFGARSVCGRGTSGWRWLDIRALAHDLLTPSWVGHGAQIERVIYCTARVSGTEDRSSPADQDVYLRALRRHGSVDEIVLGTFVTRAKVAPLAERDARGVDMPGSTFMVSYLAREEKGTDVNLATHLLVDVLTRSVDAAVVISNDSDLEMPIRVAREHVPVGVVNPGTGRPAGKLCGQPFDGVGDHWWRRIDDHAYRAHQLPPRIDALCRPAGW